MVRLECIMLMIEICVFPLYNRLTVNNPDFLETETDMIQTHSVYLPDFLFIYLFWKWKTDES